MALYFQNQTSQTVWVAFAYYDPSCGAANQNFRKLGWWQLDPYVPQFNAWDVDLRTVNRYAYFYAETANDGTNYSGTRNSWLSVNPAAAFNQCAFDDAGDGQWVDFYELDFAAVPTPGAPLWPGLLVLFSESTLIPPLNFIALDGFGNSWSGPDEPG